jgi:NADPH:quinone reductase-like Zn-dependent oxidoreductase
VYAAAINPRDWILRDGKYIFRFTLPRFPIILGSDFSGDVIVNGRGASRFRPGDCVFGMQPLTGGMGAFAEYVAVDEGAVALKPARIGHEEAAAIPCAGLTAWQAIHRIGRVQPGMRVTVCGASGGVGSYAVQFAKALGAHVTAVTSGPNVGMAKALGADAVVDYKTEDFTRVVTQQDVIFDAVGRNQFAECRKVLEPGARFVSTIPGPKIALESLLSQAVRLMTFGQSPSAHLALVRASGSDLARIAALMEEGKVRSQIDSIFPLSEIHAALTRSRTWHAKGKIVLRVAVAQAG